MESTDPADPDEGLERVALARGLLSAEQAGELRAARQAAGEPLRLAQQLLRCGLVDGPQLADLLRNASRAPRRLGRYELLREIGRGGMGVVYEALDPTLGRSVAIKLLVEQAQGGAVSIQRLRREAQLAGQLSHPGIINVHEVAEQLDDQTGERMTYIVMDHVRGPTLAALWETLSFERRIELLRQIASAMAEAHRAGVIHRDLKPENILVSGDRAIVTDFGLARGDTPSTQLTGSDAVLGTPAYMSPEQVLGHNDRLDARTDVWSLGVMLYLLATGVTPFRGNARGTLYFSILHHDPVLPRSLSRGLSRDLEAICLKALAKRTDRRYADAGALAADLDRWAAGRPVVARRAGAIYRLHRWAARNKPAVAAGVAILASVLAALVGVSYQLSVARREKTRAESEKDRAESEKDRAESERKKAEQEREKAEQRKADFDRLADVQHLRDLQAQAGRLWPRRPRLIAAYEAWIARARELVARRASHAALVARFKQDRQLEPAQQVLLGALERLVGELAKLEQSKAADPQGETIAGMRGRLAFARELARHAAGDRAAWVQAIGAIRGTPAYRGLVLARVEGLVPLGPDPTSGLWEFAHRGTGEIPSRGLDGALRLSDATGLVLVLLPQGRFQMGASRTQGPNQAPQAKSNEQPVREVSLAAFYLSKYEMTQGQWLRATGDNPSLYRAGKRYGPQLVTLRNPVTNVSWNQCREALRRLGLELPTEARWEYAARAGTQTVWPYGDRLEDLQGKANLADAIAQRYAPEWGAFEKHNDGHVLHAPVGSFAPNRWGLFDITGNVWEWCRDRYGSYTLRVRPGDGLRAVATTDRMRILRGGGFSHPAVVAGSASRSRIGPASRNNALGLRPAKGTTK